MWPWPLDIQNHWRVFHRYLSIFQWINKDKETNLIKWILFILCMQDKTLYTVFTQQGFIKPYNMSTYCDHEIILNLTSSKFGGFRVTECT